MTDSGAKVTLRIVELTERLLNDTDLRGLAAQSGCSSSSGGVGNSSSTSGSALANLTASLAQVKAQDISAAGGQG